jgi:hypothetical protein
MTGHPVAYETLPDGRGLRVKPMARSWEGRKPGYPVEDMLMELVRHQRGDVIAVLRLMLAVREAAEAARKRPWPEKDPDRALFGRTYIRHHSRCGWLDLAVVLGWTVEELFSDRVVVQLGSGDIAMVTEMSIVIVDRDTDRLIRIARRA